MNNPINLRFALLICILFFSCENRRPTPVDFIFVGDRVVTVDKIEEVDECYLFGDNERMSIKFPHTFKGDSLVTNNYDILVSLCFPVKQILRGTKEARSDDCQKELSREPVEVILDTTVSRKFKSIYIYKVFPKGKFRTICL